MPTADGKGINVIITGNAATMSLSGRHAGDVRRVNRLGHLPKETEPATYVCSADTTTSLEDLPPIYTSYMLTRRR